MFSAASVRVLASDFLALVPFPSAIRSYYPGWYPSRIQDTAEFVFNPIHQLDRNVIRPQFWDPPTPAFIIESREVPGLLLPPRGPMIDNVP